jgi:antirestriction protein ArdC
MKGKFGSADYVEEELLAELGSAFLMADLGIVG